MPKKQFTVAELRQRGLDVKVHHHYKNAQKKDRERYSVKTQVKLISPLDNVYSIGESFCCPNDNFSRKLGTRIAVNRAALALMGFPVKHGYKYPLDKVSQNS